MLFNSYIFLFLFLPVTFSFYFYLNHKKLGLAAKAWLVLCSLFFYGFWNAKYVYLILASILVNYAVGTALSNGRLRPWLRRNVLGLGVVANLALLGYYKYTDFFIANLNAVVGFDIPFIKIVLPLGISFFTFTQIAFLVDAYRRSVQEYSLLNYMLFVTFFPHLLAGPILHHKEMMPQFDRTRNKILNPHNVAAGLFLLTIGLGKKVVLADYFALTASRGFDFDTTLSALGFIDAWVTSLSYTLQLYFDFSGYTDMALGISFMFNIKLPFNFNSPYQALNIQDFWRRWHMTLSRFLRDYLYISLGGNRISQSRTYANLFMTFLLGGLWHGAGWTFILWGALHGGAIVLHRYWQTFKIGMPRWLAMLITFNFINVTWVFFRADSLHDAMRVVKGMAGVSGVYLPDLFSEKLSFLKNYNFSFGPWMSVHQGSEMGSFIFLGAIIFFTWLMWYPVNSNQFLLKFKPSYFTLMAGLCMALIAALSLGKTSPFLYFQF